MQRLWVWALKTPSWVFFLIAAALGWFGNEQRVALAQHLAGQTNLAEAPSALILGADWGLRDAMSFLAGATGNIPVTLALFFLPSAGFVLLGLLRLVARRRRPNSATAAGGALSASNGDATDEVILGTEAPAAGSPDFIRALVQRDLRNKEQKVKAKSHRSAVSAQLQQAMRNGKPPGSVSFRLAFLVIPTVLALMTLASFPDEARSLALNLASHSKEMLPPDVYSFGAVVLAKLADGQKLIADSLLSVPFLQSPNVLAIKAAAFDAITALNLAVLQITGLPVLLCAPLLALGLLGLRKFLKHREVQSFAEGREDPFERLLKRRRQNVGVNA